MNYLSIKNIATITIFYLCYKYIKTEKKKYQDLKEKYDIDINYHKKLLRKKFNYIIKLKLQLNRLQENNIKMIEVD